MKDNTKGNNLLLTGHTGEILAVKYNSTSKVLSTASSDRTILLWDAATFANTSILKSHTNAVTCLKWTYDDRLISGSADKSVAFWDIETERVIRKHKGHTCIVHDVATTKKAQSRDIIASCGDDGTLRIWDLRAKGEVKMFVNKYPLTSVCFSENGEKVMIGGIDNDIKMYSLSGEKIEENIKGHLDTISCLQISPDGAYLMSNSFDETIRIWDVRSTAQPEKRFVKTLSGHLQGHQKALIRGQWSKDGLYIGCGSIDKCVYLWDTTTRKIVQKLGGHTGTVNCVAFAEHNYLASGSNDKNVIVSQLPTIFL